MADYVSAVGVARQAERVGEQNSSPAATSAKAGTARCFLTGIEFSLEQAFVLNRRGAHDLLDALRERVLSLQRLIDQFSPLDPYEPRRASKMQKPGYVPKRHRLVCKAVADALSPGFPEIELFQRWPEYRARARRATLEGRIGASPPKSAATAATAGEAASPPEVNT